MDFNLWTNSLNLAWNQTLNSLISYIPRILFAVFVGFLGVIIGSYLKELILKTLRIIKFDQLVHDTKFQLFLKKAEVTHKLEELIAGAVKWTIVIIFFISATNIAGLNTVSQLLSGLLAYIPNIISAVLVLGLGVLLAGLVEGLVKGSLSSIDIKTARLMGKISSYTLVTVAILAALSELKIAASFINVLFIGFVSMLTLGFGLAIGLGAKDVVNKILTNWYKQIQEELNK